MKEHMNMKIYSLAINKKWNVTFKIIGFEKKGTMGEVYVTTDDGVTSIFRGDNEKEVLQEARDMLRMYRNE
jgi:hypothetical protein